MYNNSAPIRPSASLFPFARLSGLFILISQVHLLHYILVPQSETHPEINLISAQIQPILFARIAEIVVGFPHASG